MGRFKKITAILLSTVILAGMLTAMPSSASAAAQADLHVICQSNVFGKTEMTFSELEQAYDGNSYITVQYLLNAADKCLINGDIDALTYDKKVLECKQDYNVVTINRNSAVSLFRASLEQGAGAGFVNLNKAGNIVGNFSSVTPPLTATDNGNAIVVIQARFKVLDANAGDTTITCNMDSLGFCDADLQVPYPQYRAVIGCKIDESFFKNISISTQIRPMIVGDVNYDGKINTKDRIALTRYLANWNVTSFIDSVAAESIDGVSGITTKDRITLARYLSNWEGYESLTQIK